MRRLASASLLVAVALIAACGAFGDSSDDDVNPPSAQPDATVDGTSAPDDASADDAPTKVDADDAMPAEVCKTQATEQMTAIPSWQLIGNQPGTLEIITDAGYDGAGALRAFFDGTVNGQNALQYTHDQTIPKTVRASFALQIVSAVQSPDSDYAELGCSLQLRVDASKYVDLDVVLSETALRIDENRGGGGDAGPNAPLGPVVFGKWYAITMAFEKITASTAHAVVTVDGTQHVARDVQLLGPTTSVRLKCGFDYADSDFVLVALIDDVKLDFCE